MLSHLLAPIDPWLNMLLSFFLSSTVQSEQHGVGQKTAARLQPDGTGFSRRSPTWSIASGSTPNFSTRLKSTKVRSRWKMSLPPPSSLPRSSPSMATGVHFRATTNHWTIVTMRRRAARRRQTGPTNRPVGPVGRVHSIGMVFGNGNCCRLQICTPLPQRQPDLGKYALRAASETHHVSLYLI